MTKIEELIYCWENANPLPEIDDGFMLSIYRSQDKIKKLHQENERLNNIINKLEKWLKKECKENNVYQYTMAIQEILDKLKELKEAK